MQQTLNPTIPGFQIKSRIGKGGMAYVFLATQEGLGREVAIKVLQPARAEEPSIRHQFLKEGQIIAGFNHPNIVMVYASGEANGNCYLAMEYLAGGTLRERLDVGLAPTEAVRITRDLAQALAVVHQAGFVHRDIKPQNIVFRADGSPVLTDFGIAKTYVEQLDAERTGTGIKKGTVRYMSPEQINNSSEELDGRSDLYSLGVVFYWMLVGNPPYESDTINGLLQEILGGEIPPLPAKLAMFQPIMDRLLTKDRERRFENAEALIQALDRLDWSAPQARSPKKASAASTGKSPTRAGHPPWRRPLPLAGGLLGLALVGLAALVLWPDPEGDLLQQIQLLSDAEAEDDKQHQQLVAERKSRLAALTQELETLKANITQAEARREQELDDLRSEQAMLQTQRDEQQQRLEQLRADEPPELQDARQAVEALKEQLATLTGELEAARNQQDTVLEDLKIQAEQLQAQQDQVRKAIATLDAERDQARKAAEAELAQKRSDLAQLHGELDGLNQELEDALAGYQQELAELEEQRQALRQQIAEQEDAIIQRTGELEAQVAAMREQLAREEEDLSTRLAQRQRQLASLQETSDALREHLALADDSDPAVETLETQLASVQSTLDELQARVAAIPVPEPVPEAVVALLDEARSLIAEDRLTVGSRNAVGVCGDIQAQHEETGNRCFIEIGDRFHELTMEKLAEGDPDTAGTYVTRGLEIRPGHPALTAIQHSLELLAGARALIDQDRFLSDGENDGLAALLEASRTAPDNPLVRTTLTSLADSVREGRDLVKGNMDRQIQALNRGLEVVAGVLAGQPGDAVLAALQEALQARLDEARTLQEQEIDLLLEAQQLADAGAFDQSVSPNACDAYQAVLGVNPANQEAKDVLAEHCLSEEVIAEIDEALGMVSSPPVLADAHPFIRVLGASPKYHQACQGLSEIATDLYRRAADLGPDEREQALELLKDGLDFWPGHPQLQSLAAELRQDVDPGRADSLIDQAYNRQVRERVLEAWSLYQQALALSSDNPRVRAQIPKLARWSLAYRSRNLDYVVLADQIYRELLRMGEDYDGLENRLRRIEQLYSGRHRGNPTAQRRLASLRVLMANEGRSLVSECATPAVVASQAP